MEREDVDAIVFGGDIASGPFPVETLALVRSLDAYSILGNGDRPFRGRPEAAWVWDQHSEEEIGWLGALPEQLVLGNTLFVHATPRSIEEVVTPVTPDERLAAILDAVEQSVVVGGHTHMQQDRRVGRWRFVNAGSVGMPYEERPGAYWAIVDDDVELRRTDYDLAAAAEAIRASGWPIAEEFADENVLQVPSREEAATLFERMATETAEP